METITWNQQVVKKNNKSLVLQMVMEKEPISRADIAQFSGLNKATVSSLVSELLEEELIYESGPGESSGGRRPVILHFNKVAGYAIGIDIGVNYILGILTDLNGNILIEKNESINKTDFLFIIEEVKQMIRGLIKEMPGSRYGIVGIGIGVPGIVDREGTILLAPNLGWKEKSLKTEIQNEFSLPVIIENEANAGAYGEKKFGAGQNFQNIIYISAGIGIGVGIILNGELYQGHKGYSGEMGHMIIEVNGKKCSCGSRGCWEAYASEQALLTEADKEDATLEALIQLVQNGDDKSALLFEKIGSYLGYGINNIINIFNPEKVVIGNRLAKAKTWLENSLIRTVETHALPYHQKELEISFSQLTIYSAALGLSASVVDNFIKDGEKTA